MIHFRRICLMLPTYGRHDTKLPNFVDSAMEKARDISQVCFCFVVNEEDAATSEYLTKRFAGSGVEYEVILENKEQPHLADYFNMAYTQTGFNKPETLVSMFGDDMVFKTDGWDTMMLEKMNDMRGLGVVYGDDDNVQHENLCVYFVTSQRFVELTEHPFMCPEFEVDWIDNVWMELTRRLGCASYLPNLHVEHDHANKVRQPDAVWLRMRAHAQEMHDKRGIIGDYVDELVEAVRRNLKALLPDDLAYVMTTYDRVPLLERTAKSWNKSMVLPGKVRVYDDRSVRSGAVERAVKSMTNAEFVVSENHSGCDQNNIRALRDALKDERNNGVMVIDSDSAFSPQWAVAAAEIWDEVKADNDAAGGALFDAAQHKTVGSKTKNVLVKKSAGGFGAIYKRETIERALADFERENSSITWDNRINVWAAHNQRHFLCTAKSYLQHTGYVKGLHTNDLYMGDFAENYVGTIETIRKTRTAPIKSGRVLFSAMARLGDVVAASMIGNMLTDRGIDLHWLVLAKYQKLLKRICPKCNPIPVSPDASGPYGDWSETSTEQMKENYKGYEAYVNAQLGSRENHGEYVGSGKHPCVWMRDLCNRVLGVELGDDFSSYLRFNDAGIVVRDRSLKIPDRLAIISPSAKTSPVFSGETLKDIEADLSSKGYNVRMLVESRPWGLSIREARAKYIWDLSILECIVLLRKASHFVGQDSGMAWCSLYSPCSKEVYHSEKRLRKVNTRFEHLDKKAKDVIAQ